jgi:hypothetical protein
MKKLQTLLAAAMCGAIFAAAAARADVQGYGTVVRVDGKASYSLGDNNWHPLQAGKYLPVGSTIRTGDNGEVDVVLGREVLLPQATSQPDRISLAPDSPVRGMVNYKPSAEQNVIRVTPNTTIAIEKLTVTDTGADTVSDTELNLKEGKIYASVKKISGASQYLIKLPNGIAGVRGTLFGISANGDVECFESQNGGVVLSLVGSDGLPKTFLVGPGQMFSPSGGSSNIPPALQDSLHNIFNALRTIYYQAVNFSFDHTQVWVSPTQGGRGHHKGGGNSGNGGGNGGGD